MKLVSLVPSTTYTLASCPQLKSQLIACTKFCVEPPDLHCNVALVGGTKDPDLSKIRQLQPSHILVNREENKPDDIEELRSIAAVHESLPKSPEDVLGMFAGMGDFLEEHSYFNGLIAKLQSLLEQIARRGPWSHGHLTSGVKYLYLIWREPYMLVGQDTYISRLLELVGWKNAYHGQERYPSLSVTEMLSLDADLILLSTEPFPFRERHWQKLQDEWRSYSHQVPNAYKIDGRLCSWHGLKTIEAVECMLQLSNGSMPMNLIKPLSQNA
ncbi:MAG: helical backbone metal receptor [Oligoflexus sp.]